MIHWGVAAPPVRMGVGVGEGIGRRRGLDVYPLITH